MKAKQITVSRKKETMNSDNKKALNIEQVKDTIRALLVKYHAEAAILFGSYARMEADDVSDIDVVIIGGGSFEPTDVFSLAEDLHRMTQKKVDVYELREINQQSDFYRTILREGVRIAA